MSLRSQSLNGRWDEDEMLDWGTEMPSSALDILHMDLRTAQREHRKSHKPQTPAEHSAAS